MSLLRSTPVAALRRRLFCTTPSNGGSHSDFSRVIKKPHPGQETASESDEDVHARIKEHLDEHKVVLFMKGLPSQPECGFSWKTVQILNAVGVEYKAHNVLVDRSLRKGIKTYSAWPTIPQLYVDGEFIGGCDIVESLARSGELQKALKEAGVYPLEETKSS